MLSIHLPPIGAIAGMAADNARARSRWHILRISGLTISPAGHLFCRDLAAGRRRGADCAHLSSGPIRHVFGAEPEACVGAGV